MKNAQRLAKLEAKSAQKAPGIRRKDDVGIATEARLRRCFDAIKRLERENEPLPPFDWQMPSVHPLVEKIRLRVLAERNANT